MDCRVINLITSYHHYYPYSPAPGFTSYSETRTTTECTFYLLWGYAVRASLRGSRWSRHVRRSGPLGLQRNSAYVSAQAWLSQ